MHAFMGEIFHIKYNIFVKYSFKKKQQKIPTNRIAFAWADNIGLRTHKPFITELSSLNWMATYLKLLHR